MTKLKTNRESTFQSNSTFNYCNFFYSSFGLKEIIAHTYSILIIFIVFLQSGFKRTLCNSAFGNSLFGGKTRTGCCPINSFMSHPFIDPFSVEDSCSSCPSDSSSSFTNVENDEISCNTKCPKPMYYDGLINGCQDCPAGKFGESDGICTDCALGMYSIVDPVFFGKKGNLKCENCLGGKTTDAEGSSKITDCKACEAGRYSDPGKSCKACPAGWEGTDLKRYCIECTAGKFQNTETICEDCPINTYTNQKAQITCTDCVAAANSVKGSSVCVKCEVGQYMPAGNDRSCVKCPAGKFSNYGKVECTECDLGYYADKTIAATGCKSCPSGQYGSSAVAVAVVKRINKDDACDTCVIGKYSKAKGADSVETCIDCQPGKKAQDGQVARTQETDACTNCLVGQYRSSTDTDLTKCIGCTLGTYADAEGLTKCLACAAGTYSDVHITESIEGKDFCKSCIVGQYRPSQIKVNDVMTNTDLTKCKFKKIITVKTNKF